MGRRARPVPTTMEWVDDTDGVGITVRLAPEVAASRVVFVVLGTDNRPLPGRGPYSGHAGAFTLSAAVRDRFARVFAPYGAIGHRSSGWYTLVGLPLGVDGRSLGTISWPAALPLLEPRPFSRAQVLAPLVGLVMAVIGADGEITREEVHHARVRLTGMFGLQQEDQPVLRDLMKAPVPSDLGREVRRVLVRFAGDSERVCSFLLDLAIELAALDGVVDPREADVVRRIVSELVPPWVFPEVWAGVERRLQEACKARSADGRRRHLQRLGLGDGASVEEIKAAYRKTVKEYHPDRFAGHPVEFRELANRLTVELNQAYQALTE